MNEILTVNDAASILGKHPDTVRIWIKSGRLKATHIPAGESGVYALLKEDVLECALEKAKSKEKRDKSQEQREKSKDKLELENQTRLPI